MVGKLRFKLQISTLLALLVVITLPAAVLAQATMEDMGSGSAWVDYDGDGDMDKIYLTPEGDVHVMQNDSDGFFVDVSDPVIPSSVRNLASPGLSVVCGDIDNDGHEDIFLTRNGENFLLQNNGDGTFRAVTRTAGISGAALTASSAFFDYDNDGLLDLFVGNYEGKANQLWHNLGVESDGTPRFENVAATLGIDFAQNGQSNWALGVCTADFDNDGDVDLYIGNDYNGPDGLGGLSPGTNIYYRNNGDGTFTDATFEAGLGDPGWAMGVAAGDYNGDGLLDLFVANFWEDTLYENNGDGTFTEATRTAKIITDAPTEWHYNGWGTSFVDFDNDGDMDIHVVNGFIPNDQGQIDEEPDQLWENQGGGVSGQLYTFKEVGIQAGIANIGDSRGAAYGDIDHDGLWDFFVINNDYINDADQRDELPSVLLYRNFGDGTFQDQAQSRGLRPDKGDGDKPSAYRDFTANRWLQIHPEGVTSNRSGLGARVTLRHQGKIWVQELGAGSYCSQNSSFLHFGLGANDYIEELEVRFLGGNTVTVQNVAANQCVTIREGESPDITPVRLVSFGLASEDAGMRVRWSYNDDGDLHAFRLSRVQDGAVTVVAPFVLGDQGRAEFLDPDAPAGTRVLYRLEALLRNGSVELLREEPATWRPVGGWRLGQNFPNPVAGATRIPVFAPRAGEATVTVFDVSGRALRVLERTLAAGENALLEWDGQDDQGRAVSSGTYFYRLQVNGFEQTRKMIVRN